MRLWSAHHPANTYHWQHFWNTIYLVLVLNVEDLNHYEFTQSRKHEDHTASHPQIEGLRNAKRLENASKNVARKRNGKHLL